ncbi:MAG: GntR family transcriptional regulator [Salaquimonas sp.]|nr:GntR family transcriptional regulator [Salaquimonas sp.]
MNMVLQLETLGAESVRHATMGQRVFETLRQAIVQLQLRPGNLLSEAEIARQLGVSRQPVREAFIKLAEAGLVEIRPQRGTLVQLISRREVETARFMREAIEVAIARKAAVEENNKELVAIRQTLERQREASDEGDIAAFMRADDAFHRAIASMADCEDAWKILEGLKVQMDRVRYLSMPLATPVETLIGQHEKIFEAIAGHSPDKADAAMRQHLSEILKSLPHIVEAHGEMFTD